MKIQLKEKHLCLIVAHLQSSSLQSYFKLVSQIKEKCVGALPDDTVEVECTSSELTQVWQQFSNKPEGMYLGVNTEISDMLMPQFQSKIIAGMDANSTPEQIAEKQQAEQVAAYITATKAKYNSELLNLIASGRSLLA